MNEPFHGLEKCPPDDVLRERLDSILGDLFQLDTRDDSALRDGWEWEVRTEYGLPMLALTIDRIHEPQIRFRIVRILDRMNLKVN